MFQRKSRNKLKKLNSKTKEVDELWTWTVRPWPSYLKLPHLVKKQSNKPSGGQEKSKILILTLFQNISCWSKLSGWGNISSWGPWVCSPLKLTICNPSVMALALHFWPLCTEHLQ